MDRRERGAAADRRGSTPLDRWAAPLERAGRLFATAAILFMASYAAAVVLVLTSGYVEGASRQVDFVALWSAAKLALQGNAIEAFDQGVLRQNQFLPPEAEPGELYWLYPPGLQMLLAPFGLLPYWAAWLLFCLMSLVAFARVLWAPAGRVPMGHSVLVCAPAVIITVQTGQLSMLWAVAVVGALRAMTLERAALAGLLIALLSLKPQLGLLLPVVLVAAWRWDVLLWAAGGVLAVHALPTLIVGLEYWAVFLDRMGGVAEAIELDLMQHQLMVSPYAFGRFLDLGHGAALVGQGIVTLSLAGAVFRAWSRGPGHIERATGILLAAMPAATPYAYYYELTLCVPAAIFLVLSGYGARLADRVLLALVVFGPAVLWISTPLAPLFAPVLLAIVFHSLARMPAGGTAARSAAPSAASPGGGPG